MEQHNRLEIESENATDEVRTLVHELGTLLDGSMRCLRLARRALQEGEADTDSMRRLETVGGALDRMADLVRGAMRGQGFVGTGFVSRVSVTRAIEHARDVSIDRAEELGIEIRVELDTSLASIRAGQLYAVVLNGVRNAIDSIERGGRSGRVLVVAGVVAGTLEITIRDDGEGLSPGRSRTPTGGMGIGLGLCRSIVEGLGGSIELRERGDGGAELCVRVPIARLENDSGGLEIG